MSKSSDMPKDLTTATKIYQRIAARPNIISGQILQKNPLLVSATWKTQDYHENSSTSYTKIYTQNENKSSFTTLSKTICEPTFSSMSPSRNLSCRIRKLKSDEKPTKPDHIIEIWDESSQSRIVYHKIDKKSSGCESPTTNDTFGSITWNKSENKVAFICEPYEEPSKSFFSASNSDSVPPGGKHFFNEDFHEQLYSTKKPTLAVFDIAQETLTTYTFEKCVRRPLFLQEDILLIAEENFPYKLGRIYCDNKPTQVVRFNERSGFCKFLNEKSSITELFSRPGHDNEFFYFERRTGLGPHYDVSRLCKWEDGSTSVVIDYVEKANDDFNGFYVETTSTPDGRRFLTDSEMIVESFHGSKMLLFKVNVDEKTVESLETSLPKQKILDLTDEMILLAHSSPKQPDSLAIYDLASGKILNIEQQQVLKINYQIEKFSTDGVE